MQKSSSLPKPIILLFIPIGVYILSYVYLAFYHGHIWIFDTIVHESGQHTLLKTILYASHFLGHIPVHTVLALFFTGIFLSLSQPCHNPVSLRINLVLCVGLSLFLALCIFISIHLWGQQDTINFIAQQKQSEVIYGQGGSWNLHLPSTMLQFLLIPVYIYAAKLLFRQNIIVNHTGIVYMLLSLFFFFIFSYINNPQLMANMKNVWQNPRYLAHSIRELMTFSATYYPIPLFFMLRHHQKYSGRTEGGHQKQNQKFLMIFLGAAFLILVAYQAYVPLTKGIGTLAQKPSFAKSGQLTITYLLASHFFEHFLDTIYFSLVCIIFYFFSFKKQTHS